MNQRDVWDAIARDWNEFRKVPVSETEDFLKNKKGLVLDLACGSGRHFEDKITIGMDFSENMIKLARKNVKSKKLSTSLLVGDSLDLPFKDDSFDVIIFSKAIHCIKINKHRKVLEEIKRVAKNKSCIFISAWNRDQPRFDKSKKEAFVPWKVKGKSYQRYYYLYTMDEFESNLKKYFKNVKVFGSSDKAFGRYSKDLIATARVSK